MAFQYKCEHLSPRRRAIIYWVFSLFALLINGSSLASTYQTPWAISSSHRFGLWGNYTCPSTSSTCSTYDSYITENANNFPQCRKVSTSAGVIMIIVVCLSALTFMFRLAVCCSKKPGYASGVKVLVVLKAVTGLCLPIIAMAIWMQDCYYKITGESALIWGTGQGILIVSLFCELVSFYGIPPVIKDPEESK